MAGSTIDASASRNLIGVFYAWVTPRADVTARASANLNKMRLPIEISIKDEK